MIAKIIASGRDRDEALGRLRRAMAETTVVIEGGATNKSFMLDLLDQPEVIDATADTGWIDRVRGEGGWSRTGTPGSRWRRPQSRRTRRRSGSRSAAAVDGSGGRPQVQHNGGRALDLKLRGVGYKLPRRRGSGRTGSGAASRRATTTARRRRTRADRRYSSRIIVEGTRYRLSPDLRADHLVEVDGVDAPGQPRRGRRPALARAGAGRGHAGGRRRRGRGGRCGAGARVDEDGDGAARAVRGAVKELPVSPAARSRRARRCCGWSRSPRTTRRPRPTRATRRRTGPAARLRDLPEAERGRARAEDLRGLLLGYDVDPRDERRMLAAYLAARQSPPRPVAGRWPRNSTSSRCSRTCRS